MHALADRLDAASRHASVDGVTNIAVAAAAALDSSAQRCGMTVVECQFKYGDSRALMASLPSRWRQALFHRGAAADEAAGRRKPREPTIASRRTAAPNAADPIVVVSNARAVVFRFTTRQGEMTMSRLSVIAIALGMLFAAACSSQEMQALQQKCNAGDKSACSQISQSGGSAPPAPLPMAG